MVRKFEETISVLCSLSDAVVRKQRMRTDETLQTVKETKEVRGSNFSCVQTAWHSYFRTRFLDSSIKETYFSDD
jgi:hypothetical protein